MNMNGQMPAPHTTAQTTLPGGAPGVPQPPGLACLGLAWPGLKEKNQTKGRKPAPHMAARAAPNHSARLGT